MIAAHRILALFMLAASMTIGGTLPYARWPVLLASFALAAFVSRWPTLLPATVVALIPLIDLTPWTGRFYVNELDACLLALLGGALGSPKLTTPSPLKRLDALLVASLALSCAISLVAGITSACRDEVEWGNACDHALNAVRIARPVVYSLAFGYLLSGCRPMRQSSIRSLSIGFGVGLACVVVSVGLERLRFCGLFNTQSGFRVTGSFADMHVGGAALDAYLVLAMPFLVSLWRLSPWGKFATILLTPGCLYATVATLSRAPLIVLACSGLVLAVAWPSRASVPRRIGIRTALAVVWGLLFAGAIVMTPALQTRFVTAKRDLWVRVEHWRESLKLPGPSPLSQLVGIGCGSFPRAFRGAAGQLSPRDYQFRTDGAQSHLRLIPQGPVYLGQRIDTEPHTTYALAVRCRTVGKAGELRLSLSEKNPLSSSRINNYHWSIGSTGPNQWVEISDQIDVRDVGAPLDRSPFPVVRRPVWLSLTASDETIIDIDQIQLLDEQGNNLIANGDFNAGHDRWWWTADHHPSWHALNLYVHLLVEQGWLGLLSFLAISTRGLARVAKLVSQGNYDATTVGAAIGGGLALGSIDSVIDSPRVALLYYLLISFTLVASPQEDKACRERP